MVAWPVQVGERGLQLSGG
jgi:ATP-binding cassette, subfamily B (MDR/TAP), member 1